MSVTATQSWIASHKRKDNAVEIWNEALALTKQCATEARRYSGFEAATAYYNCRRGMTVRYMKR